MRVVHIMSTFPTGSISSPSEPQTSDRGQTCIANVSTQLNSAKAHDLNVLLPAHLPMCVYIYICRYAYAHRLPSQRQPQLVDTRPLNLLISIFHNAFHYKERGPLTALSMPHPSPPLPGARSSSPSPFQSTMKGAAKPGISSVSCSLSLAHVLSPSLSLSLALSLSLSLSLSLFLSLSPSVFMSISEKRSNTH